MTRALNVVTALISIFADVAAAQDVRHGENVFRQFMICHAIGPGAQHKIGPELNGLDGRHSETVAKFDWWLKAALRERQLPRCKRKGWNLSRYGRVDVKGVGAIGLSASRRRSEPVCHATGSCAQLADRLDNCGGGAELRAG
jgi:hypothetical protein